MTEVTEFSEEQYREAIKTGNWVIDYWAPWCGPCKQMAPFFHEAAGKQTKAKFGKIDVQKFAKVAQELSIMSIPCLIYLKDGKEVHRTIGFIKTDQILQNVEIAFP